MQNTDLSATKRLALSTLDFIKERIIKGDCSDEELQENMSRINCEANDDYINKNDYVNADQAIKILGIGYNRNKLFELTKKYGVVNHTLNNQHIGFKRKEIELSARRAKIDSTLFIKAGFVAIKAIIATIPAIVRFLYLFFTFDKPPI